MKTIMINGRAFCRIETTKEDIERCFPMAKKIIETPIGFNVVI